MLSSLSSFNDLLRVCASDEEKVSLRVKLNEKQFRYNMIMEKRTGRVFIPEYHEKIMDKLG